MRRRLLPLAIVLATLAAPATAQIEVFPVRPAVNEQRGFAIAMDGDWLAIGARLEDFDGGGVDLRNAGAVHLFLFDTATGTWKELQAVVSGEVQENGQFGFAISLRGNRLAVGEPGAGDGAGVVHVFSLQGSEWVRQSSLPAPAGEMRFGRSVAIDGNWLAVGAGDPHGETPGTVRLFSDTGDGWTEAPPLTGSSNERFGHALALRNGVLAVGAPGADGAKGAVHVYRQADGIWAPSVTLKDPHGGEGDQLGFAVATDGQSVVIGAPTAGSDNSGTAWLFRGEGLEKLGVNGGPGGQLGYAVAIDDDRIAVSAPFENEVSGAVHLLARESDSWIEKNRVVADNAGSYDLSGFSVALSGKWLMFGKPAGDYGGSAAGSISSYLCETAATCKPEGELSVRVDGTKEIFGVSVAADRDLFAVGARGRGDGVKGSVTVFRKAAEGWRQEARLSLEESEKDEFGAAVAVHQDPVLGDLLVVGDPQRTSAGPGGYSGLSGSVYLYRKIGREWQLEARLVDPDPSSSKDYGQAVATDGSNVVVGASIVGFGLDGLGQGAAYVFEKEKTSWSAGTILQLPEGVASPGDDPGFSVAIRGDTIAVGAPFANGFKGEVHIFQRLTDWTWRTNLASGASDKEQFGFSVALEQFGNDYVLIAGAPHWNSNVGAIYFTKGSGPAWIPIERLAVGAACTHLLGSAVSIRAGDLVAGSPGPGPDPGSEDCDKVFVMRWSENKWGLEGHVDAPEAVYYNAFGASVAVGDGFFVVASPGTASIGLPSPSEPTGGRRDDRVSVFKLPQE